MVYVWMLFRDIERLQQNFKSTNKLPLGAGAVAGSSFSVNQQYVADLLNFDAIYCNSIDAVSDRDYLVEFLSAASLIMMHLSKLCEELIIWTSQEFAFIEIDDAFCTGSSMMPHKKNPDSAELIRGKTGRVYGSLMSMLTMLKGLPLAYNKDLQEDKEGVFDAVKTVNCCLLLMAKMMASLKFNQEQIANDLDSGFLIATELANYLVKKGMPFRKAHETIGGMVKHCIKQDLQIADLGLTGLQDFSGLFQADVLPLLSVKEVVEQQRNICGTAKDSVLNQINLAEDNLATAAKWCSEKTKTTAFE
jgi:argininosuccinate lyase